MPSKKKILITSGPTRYPLDAVRFISNVSTGRFGTLLAKEALKREARVTFIYGKGSQIPPKHPRLKLIEVETSDDLTKVLKRELTHFSYDMVLHAMAVLDFRPQKIRGNKTKTKQGNWVVPFVPTPKVINLIKKWDPKIILIGFKLEVGVAKTTLVRRAQLLLKDSGADFILANQLGEGDDFNHVGFFLDPSEKILFEARGKASIAKKIFSHLFRSNKKGFKQKA